MASRGWIAIDFDHTLYDTPQQTFMPGAREAVCTLREMGWKVLIHSCNNVEFIRGCMRNEDIPFDGIWGEDDLHDYGAKPVCAAYVDDKGLRFDPIVGWSEDFVASIDALASKERVWKA